MGPAGAPGAPGAEGAPGAQGIPGNPGQNGQNGDDGRGVANMQITDGDLVVSYSDGQEQNLGNVVGPEGPAPEAGGGHNMPTRDGRFDANYGEVLPGTSAVSQEAALDIPDNNPLGVSGVIFFNPADLTIERFTIDLSVTHADVSELTITLTSPTGTEVVLQNPAAAGGENLSANFPRTRLPAVGTMEDFYGEDPRGLWTLEIIDSGEGNAGQLTGWSINVNEEWGGSEMFVGNGLVTDGLVKTRKGVEINMGGDLVMRNSRGQATIIFNGESGSFNLNSSALKPMLTSNEFTSIQLTGDEAFLTEPLVGGLAQITDGDQNSYMGVKTRNPVNANRYASFSWLLDMGRPVILTQIESKFAVVGGCEFSIRWGSNGDDLFGFEYLQRPNIAAKNLLSIYSNQPVRYLQLQIGGPYTCELRLYELRYTGVFP